ncbi:MAG TPA: hypothetical protein VG897_18380, partial [Terriglobales bacterium]|nr:hypothetical protein [Terriglobales bacterium]
MRELVFAWFHPHYRRRGYLTATWTQITARWSPFLVQQPISPAMKHFLNNKQSGSTVTTDAQAFAIPTFGGRDVLVIEIRRSLTSPGAKQAC